jgi:hypothetical protein
MAIVNWLIADAFGAGVGIFFTFTIILMLRDDQKPPVLTGIMTGLALIILGTGGSYRESAPAFISVINGLLWLFLAWQRFNKDNVYN